MPYFVISNFSSGLDLRRSSETAPSGSLRVLRNAFINEGAEIEKRKAFVRQEDVTEYGQNGSFKGRITGPFVCPNAGNTVFFRHRSADVPGAPFLSNGNASRYIEDIEDATGQVLQKFWVQPSTLTLPASYAMFHSPSASEFSSTSYVVEAHFEETAFDFQYQHVSVSFTDDEPMSEVAVAANDGRPFQRIFQNKGYVVSGNTIFGSAVGDPTDMIGVGSWSNDLTTQGTPIGATLALADYFGQLVVFGGRGMMFWQVDPDPALNQYLRTVPGSVYAQRAVTGYASGDILFLSRSGVRSLQARDSSNMARVSDVGSPIDSAIRADLSVDADEKDALFGNSAPELSNALFCSLATGIVHQDSGQFWMALKDKIYVLSRYPSAKVLAWSAFDLPYPEYSSPESGSYKSGWVADWCEISESVVFRNFADEVFVYGGPDGAQYDDSEVEVILPFMDMGRPGSVKKFTGIDAVCEGIWTVEFTTDYAGDDRDADWAPIAELDGSTRSGSRIAFEATGTQISLRLTCSSDRAARLSEIMIHYNEGSQK